MKHSITWKFLNVVLKGICINGCCLMQTAFAIYVFIASLLGQEYIYYGCFMVSWL